MSTNSQLYLYVSSYLRGSTVFDKQHVHKLHSGRLISASEELKPERIPKDGVMIEVVVTVSHQLGQSFKLQT